MRLLLLGFGTTGDVLPLVHLAHALGAVGNEVTVVSSPMFEGLAAGRNFRFLPEGPALDPARIAEAFAAAARAGPLGELRAILGRIFLADAEAYAKRAERLARGYDAAIIHGLDFAGIAAVRRAGKPWASVMYCPAVIPTRGRSAARGRSYGALLNQLSWWALDRALCFMNGDLQKRLAQLGPMEGHRWLGTPSPSLNLVAASEVVTGPLDDLPATFHATGDWRETSLPAALPQQVQAFVAGGRIDVALSFGSVIGFDGGEPVGEAFAAVCEALGLRGILQRGWAGEEASSDADLLVIGEVSYDALYPHVDTVVHHGGAGVSHAAVRAGASSIVVSHVSEQAYWGRTLYARGFASPPLRRAEWSRSRLERALLWLKDHPRSAQSSAEARDQLRAENGTARAVLLIERWAKAGFQALRREPPKPERRRVLSP